MPDVLSDILQTLRLRGSLYYRLGFSPPFGVQVPEYKQSARFHLCVRGRCIVRPIGGATIDLSAGDLVLVPRGRSHCLLDEPERAFVPLERVLEAAGYRGEGVVVMAGSARPTQTELVCGHFTFREGADHPMLRLLPDLIVVSAAARARFGWLDDILRMLTRRVFEAESEPSAQGLVASVQRLAEVMFVEVLRAGVAQSPDLQRVVAAFSDSRVGRALALIHAHPEKPWTVESLADAAGMSRARFADLFAEAVGEGPMAYVRAWRLQRAAALLEETRLSVQEIAGQVGYASTAAFSRAFAQQFGTAPTLYRPERA